MQISLTWNGFIKKFNIGMPKKLAVDKPHLDFPVLKKIGIPAL